MKVLTPLKAMRRNCLECSGDSSKVVAYCPCDGVNSTKCEFWPYRFGYRPQNIVERQFVTPGALPGSDVPVEELPVPKITRKGAGRSLTPEQRQKLREQLQRGRQKQLVPTADRGRGQV